MISYSPPFLPCAFHNASDYRNTRYRRPCNYLLGRSRRQLGRQRKASITSLHEAGEWVGSPALLATLPAARWSEQSEEPLPTGAEGPAGNAPSQLPRQRRSDEAESTPAPRMLRRGVGLGGWTAGLGPLPESLDGKSRSGSFHPRTRPCSSLL